MIFCFLVAEPHQYQLRVYIYQARDLLPSDQDGYSGTLTVMDVKAVHRLASTVAALCPLLLCYACYCRSRAGIFLGWVTFLW